VLAIRCELLLGSYQAANPFATAQTPEWPPHPYRLHAALVAAACERGGSTPDGEALDALAWLEEQAPPGIACTLGAQARSSGRSWVPRNPTPGGEQKRYFDRRTIVNRVERAFPTAVPADPALTYVWPEATQVPVAALEGLVGGISWLGSSRSPVSCATTATAPAAALLPGTGERPLRVADVGLTARLLEARFRHPLAVRVAAVGYGERGDVAAVERPVAGPFSELLVRRIVRATQELADAPLIGAALRVAVLSRAGDGAPPALHGHTDGRGHAAYLTLGDVGHRGAHGSVRGVGLALPHDLEADERRRCIEAFVAVDELGLPDGRTPLFLDDAVSELWALAVERWSGPAREWATATPIVLDRFPRRSRSVEDEVRASVANAGLADPVAVALLAGPPVPGAPQAGRLRGSVARGLRVHARLRFRDPVRGPVAVGRGRFRGVGLLVPVDR
jgi:CRISPR-associated protein Csb2